MSTDRFISQTAPRSPATDLQTDKIGSCGLNQSSKTKIFRDSFHGDRDNFLNTLKKVARDRVLNKRLKFAPDESLPVTGALFDVREMDLASPYQKAPDWKFQQSEKNTKAAPSPKETEPGQRIPRYQITDQIIRKAAFHLRNGQHEVIINLKSDFLGHIRMQVISENQQVTVRILVENSFVKDLIESNLHQLKADLQQQGLEVDKLEVRVAWDPEDSGNSKKFAQWRAGQGNVDHQKHANQKGEQQNDNGQPLRTASNAAIVDYFA
ncbi:MAG: flagellar hook-length control protein FliK [bacterium]|nr:flagellar hook-length control protein FliK [bacterium]